MTEINLSAKQLAALKALVKAPEGEYVELHVRTGTFLVRQGWAEKDADKSGKNAYSNYVVTGAGIAAYEAHIAQF